MSSPIKPWEGAGINSRGNTPIRSSLNPRPSTPYGDRPNNLIRGASTGTTMNEAAPDCCTNPPPVPNRPQRSTHGGYNGGNGMMGGYGGYGSSMYGHGSGLYGSSYGGMHGGYGGGYSGGYGSGYSSGYGGGYGGYSRFSNHGNQMSPFVRKAEENSQAAFQSVESIVQAFGSISMMLESTHFAMLNTFRAVLGAADHFGRLKSHILSAIGAIAIIKTLKSLCNKVLYMFGLMRNSGIENEVWTEVNSSVPGAVGSEGSSKKSTKSWPIVMFFAVVLGVPWVIWKMLKAFVSEDEDVSDWMTGAGDHVLARVEYDFVGEAEDELSVSAGSVIKVAPKDKQPHIRGWILATVDGEREGIIPANYVKILGLRRGNIVKPDGAPCTSADGDVACANNQTLQASSSNADLGTGCSSSSSDLGTQYLKQMAGTSSANAQNETAELNSLDFEMPTETQVDFLDDVPT